MSSSFSNKVFRAVGLSLWVPAVFIGGQLVTLLLFMVIAYIIPDFKQINATVYSTIFAALSYSLALAGAIGLPYAVRRRHMSLDRLGLQRLLGWSDIGVGVLALLPYYILAGVLFWLAAILFPDLDASVAQAIPYQNLTKQYEYLAAFIALVILAPFAEEVLFRGYFLGKLQPIIGGWRSVLIVAVVFALLHLPGTVTEQGIGLQWTVMIDVFALGLVLGTLRMFTGSIWAGVLLHTFKNMIAFYFLFIYRG